MIFFFFFGMDEFDLFQKAKIIMIIIWYNTS